MCEISTAIYIEILNEDDMQYLAPEFVIFDYLQILFHSHLHTPPYYISRRVDQPRELPNRASDTYSL
jgi:hypothetical protein